MHQNKMTLDEHRELGKALQAARNMLVVNGVKLEKSYSKTKVPSLKLQKAAELIDEVRNVLDDILFKEYPDLEDQERCEIYYVKSPEEKKSV